MIPSQGTILHAVWPKKYNKVLKENTRKFEKKKNVHFLWKAGRIILGLVVNWSVFALTILRIKNSYPSEIS